MAIFVPDDEKNLLFYQNEQLRADVFPRQSADWARSHQTSETQQDKQTCPTVSVKILMFSCRWRIQGWIFLPAQNREVCSENTCPAHAVYWFWQCVSSLNHYADLWEAQKYLQLGVNRTLHKHLFFHFWMWASHQKSHLNRTLVHLLKAWSYFPNLECYKCRV